MRTKFIFLSGIVFAITFFCSCSNSNNYEMAYFELNGPVKAVFETYTVYNEWGGREFERHFKYEFSEMGKLEYWRQLDDNFLGDYQFVKKGGKIIGTNFIPDETRCVSDYLGITRDNIVYDPNGHITHYSEFGYESGCSYNLVDTLNSETDRRWFEIYHFEGGAEGENFCGFQIRKYEIIDTDHHGNWTKRRKSCTTTYSNGYTDVDIAIQERTIRYYGE